MLLLAAFVMPVFAQDTTATATAAEEPCEKKGFSVSGSVDVYYRYDFAKTKDNNYTSFTNSHNSFELGMASIMLQQNFNKVSMVADIGFGRRAQEFSYNDEGALAAIKQLYVSYQATDWLKVSMGSWATHVGYELVDPMPNRNYSMSYMFSYGPFFHTGLKAEITKGNHGFMVGVANPTDYKFVPDEGLNQKFIIAQYSFSASEKFAAYLNFVGGQNLDSSKGNQIDLVMTSKLSDKFSLGFNATQNSWNAKTDGKFNGVESWWGTALYLNYDFTPSFGFTWRNEYVNADRTRLMYSDDSGGSIFASTLSANILVGNSFKIVPEIRIDNSPNNIFVDSKGMTTKSGSSALIAAIYQF